MASKAASALFTKTIALGILNLHVNCPGCKEIRHSKRSRIDTPVGRPRFWVLPAQRQCVSEQVIV